MPAVSTIDQCLKVSILPIGFFGEQSFRFKKVVERDEGKVRTLSAEDARLFALDETVCPCFGFVATLAAEDGNSIVHSVKVTNETETSSESVFHSLSEFLTCQFLRPLPHSFNPHIVLQELLMSK